MNYTLIVENEKKLKLNLTNRSDFFIYDIDGLSSVQATINTTERAGFDGSIYNSCHIDEKVITIYFKLLKDPSAIRNELYKYFIPKKKTTLYFKNSIRNVYIVGRVESFDFDTFTPVQIGTISIKCNEPYLISKTETNVDFSNIVPMFYFPYGTDDIGKPVSEKKQVIISNISNSGDVSTGFILRLKAYGEVINPKIYNVETKDYFAINFTMQPLDLITINTTNGNKSIELLRDGIKTNIFNNLDKSSTWLKLEPGINVLSYVADEGSENLELNLKFRNQFLGA